MATNLKAPRHLPGAVRRRHGAVQCGPAITKWAASLGFKGVQVPSSDARLFDLAKATQSKTPCDEITGIARANGFIAPAKTTS